MVMEMGVEAKVEIEMEMEVEDTIALRSIVEHICKWGGGRGGKVCK